MKTTKAPWTGIEPNYRNYGIIVPLQILSKSYESKIDPSSDQLKIPLFGPNISHEWVYMDSLKKSVLQVNLLTIVGARFILEKATVSGSYNVSVRKLSNQTIFISNFVEQTTILPIEPPAAPLAKEVDTRNDPNQIYMAGDHPKFIYTAVRFNEVDSMAIKGNEVLALSTFGDPNQGPASKAIIEDADGVF